MASTMDEEELIIAVSHMKLAGAATVTSVHAALQAKGLSVDISQVKKAEWKAVKRAVRARAVPAAAPQLPLSPPQLPLSAPPVAAPPWDERLRGSGRSFLSPRLLGGGCNGVDPRSRSRVRAPPSLPVPVTLTGFEALLAARDLTSTTMADINCLPSSDIRGHTDTRVTSHYFPDMHRATSPYVLAFKPTAFRLAILYHTLLLHTCYWYTAITNILFLLLNIFTLPQIAGAPDLRSSVSCYAKLYIFRVIR